MVWCAETKVRHMNRFIWYLDADGVEFYLDLLNGWQDTRVANDHPVDQGVAKDIRNMEQFLEDQDVLGLL